MALVLAFAAAGCACEFGPRVYLLVDLQTDLAPGYDFRAVRVRVRDEEVLRMVGTGDNFVDAARVAELRIAPGTATIVGELLAADGQVLVTRRLLADLRTDTAVRLVLAAACVGVSCPIEGETCIAGRCAPATCDGSACRLDDATLCPGGLCSGGERCELVTECASLDDGCSEPSCRGGVCVNLPGFGACGSPNYCRPGEGCLPPPDDLDAGTPRDGSFPDGDLPDGALPTFDAGVETCVVCTSICGSTGLGVCEDGVPTGECLPPPERCMGGDEDCDGRIDEALDCDHEHEVVCDVSGIVDEEPVTQLVSSVTGGLEPGVVCAGDFCVSVIERCRTLPGGDGHVHEVYVNGDDDVVFSPISTELTPGRTSFDVGHDHQVYCAIFDDTPGEPTTDTYFHDLEPRVPADPFRYNRFCTSLDALPVPLCFDNWGACEAR